jgi:hypothetical protein
VNPVAGPQPFGQRQTVAHQGRRSTASEGANIQTLRSNLPAIPIQASQGRFEEETHAAPGPTSPVGSQEA